MFERALSEDGVEDEEEEDDEEVVVMDDGEPPTTAMIEEVGPHAAGLTASQLAAVHKGTSCHQCFPALQTRVLTDTGFLFLDEIERRIKAGQRVLYACYAPDSREPQRKFEDAMKGQLVYRDGDLVYPPAPTSLIELNSTDARKRWAEGSGAYGLGLRRVVATVDADVDTEMEDRDADDDDEDEEDDQEEGDQQEEGKAKPRRRQYSRQVSLLVTPDHDLYAQMGSVSGGGVTFVPKRVVEVVGGKQRFFVLPPSKVQASQLLGAPHERASVRLLAAASSGHTTSPAAAGQVTAVKARLGLTSDAQFDTFLELLGFWLGDGTLSYKLGGAVRFSQVKEGDISFLDETLPKVGQRLQDVVRTESQLRRADGTVKTRVTWDIRDRRWFDFFDQEFGLKYKESQYYDRDATVARQGNGRPASAEQPSTPATVTRSVASSTATPSRSSTRSSIDMTDLTASDDEEVQVATPTHTRAVSSPLASALPFVRRSARRISVTERYEVYASDAEAAKAVQEAEWLYGEPVKMEDDSPIKEEDDAPIKEEDEPPLKEEEPPVDEPSDPEEEEPPEDDCDDPIKSVKWLPEWVVMRLPSRQLRLVIYGLYRADGSFKRGYNQIWTSGAAFRDQLMQALLHCGYTAMPLLQYPAGAVRAYRWHDQTVDSTVFTLKQYAAVKPEHRHLYREVRANADSWYVCWSEAVSTGKAVCWPNVRRQEGMEEVPYSVTEHGRIWCVTVHHPDHLIVAQRALRHPDTGVVCKQSRPIIVGQCKNTKQLKKLAFCANLFNKRTKPEKRVCRKKYCESSGDIAPYTAVQPLTQRPTHSSLTSLSVALACVHCVGCFLEHDTRILTSAGLLFLDQIEVRMKDATVPPLLFACYDVAAQQLLYRRGELVFPPQAATQLVEFTAAEEEHRWAEGSSAYGEELGTDLRAESSHLSLRVTPDHRMFVQLGLEDRPALSWTSGKSEVLPASSLLCRCAASERCEHRRQVVGLLAVAESGLEQPGNTAERDAVQRRLELSDEQFRAFLGLLGFFLGHGRAFFEDRSSGCAVVQLPHCQPQHRAWLQGLIDTAGLKREQVDVAESGNGELCFIRDQRWSLWFTDAFGRDAWVRRLPDWLLMQFTSTDLRLLIGGLQRASGSTGEDGDAIFTSDVQFRDQLMQALLHCGYSPHARIRHTAGSVRGYTWHDQQVDWGVSSVEEVRHLSEHERTAYVPVVATVDEWAVTWSTPRSESAVTACYPTLPQSSIKAQPYSVERDGRQWCVSVDHPDHLILAQRAWRAGADGCVTKQSRVVVVGQCLKKFYNDNLHEVVGKSWICASCRGVCCCAACTRTVKRKSTKATDIAAAAAGLPQLASPANASSPSTAHATPSSGKRSLQSQGMGGSEAALASLNSLPVPAAATAVGPTAANGMNPLAYLTQTALQDWNAAGAGHPHNGGVTAASLLASSPYNQQQLLMYSPFHQQQLSQHLQAQQLYAAHQQQAQQAQLVAALHLQQSQQQMPGSPYLPVASLQMGTAYASPLPSLPLLSSDHDLTASMRLHSLHDPSAHLSPSVSPATSPSLFPRSRPGLPSSSGKISSPSATKRMFLSHRDWPYASSSPLSSSRAVSDTFSEGNSPLASNLTEHSHSNTSTPLSGSGSTARNLSADGSLSRDTSDDSGVTKMDEGGAAIGQAGGGAGGGGGGGGGFVVGGGEGRTAFAAYSSRKDAAFSNLQRLTQKDVTEK